LCLLVIACYSILGVYDLVPLYKQKQWRDFWLNVIFTALSFAAALLLCLGGKIPSPEQPIRALITSIFGK
jgi:hypothetical protein